MIAKKITAIISALLFATATYAGHEVGGMIINYQSVAHVNNNSLQYVVTVYNLLDKNSLAAPTYVSVVQTSTCFSTTNHSLPRVSVGTNGLLPLLGSDYCSISSSIQSTIGLAIYRDTITLPGTCSDFKFAITGGFGRYNQTVNITSGFNGTYFEAKLNNMLGPNSTPQVPITDIIQAACLNKPLILYNFTEADGDSLYFESGTPKISATTTYTYAPGYSVTNQINSSAGFTVNNLTGVLNTQVTSLGVYLITINYAEFRIDTATQQRVFIAGGKYSMMLFGTSGCNSKPFEMVYKAGANPDSLACRDTIVRFATTRKIAAASLTANGSEFKVRSFKSGNINVLNAKVVTDSIIELAFAQPFASEDTLEIRAVMGTDSNVVLSRCGKELLADGDTLWFYLPNSAGSIATFSTSTNLLSASFNSAGSTGSSYIWDFGDGSPKQNSANPTHNYTAPGLYSVTLIAFNICGGNDTLIQSIRVCDSLIGNFSTSISGDTVFADASVSVGASQYYWDFGDGSTGSGISPNHVYTLGGSYLISLTVVNLCGDSTMVTDSVKLCEDPIADWTYTIVSTTSSGMLIDFDGTASVRATRYLWNFGDGTTDNTTLTPQHLYATPSLTYLVTLTIYNDCDNPNVRAFKLNQIGLEETPLTSSFSLYPNPAKATTTIQWDDATETPKEITVLNSRGEVVSLVTLKQANQSENQLDFDLRALQSGFYLLKIDVGKFTHYKRLVIE